MTSPRTLYEAQRDKLVSAAQALSYAHDYEGLTEQHLCVLRALRDIIPCTDDGHGHIQFAIEECDAQLSLELEDARWAA